MSANVRFLFNTPGEYVAFETGGNIFTPAAEWLGAVVDGRFVFNAAGVHVGFLLDDDRVVREVIPGVTRQNRPLKGPMRPIRPVPPMRRLMMPRVLYPLEDMFDRLLRPLRALVPTARLHQLEFLEGCFLVAGDGTLLGVISRNRSEAASISNLAGVHGLEGEGASIFREDEPYGSPVGDLSPFSETAASPPQILQRGQPIGCVSANPAFPDRIDPNELIAWLATT